MAEVKLIRDHHLLTRNLRLNGNYLSNDGGDEGISISDAGDMTFSLGGNDLTIKDSAGLNIFTFNAAEPEFRVIDDAANPNNYLSVAVSAAAGATISTVYNSGSMSLALSPDGKLTLNTGTNDLQIQKDGVNRGKFYFATANEFWLGAEGVSDSLKLAGAGITLDSSADIILDADGDQVSMKFGGATGQIDFSNENSGDGVIRQMVDAKDLVIQQFDGTEVARFTDGANVGIGVSDPASPLEIFNTASQLKISYDASNYADISVASDGHLELATTGDAADLTLDAAGDIYLEYDTNLFINGHLNLSSNKYIYFDSADTKIGTNADDPEDMVIEADQDILMAPDNNLDITAGGEIDFNTATCGFTAQTGTDAVSIDWGEGNKYHLLLENNSTVTFATNPTNPCNLLLKVVQGNGGSKIITWAVTSGDIYWAGGGKTDTDKPTLTTTDDDSDILSFYWDGTNYFGVASLNFDTAS